MAEEDTMVQDMMGMMMVIMMVAVLSQMIPGAALAAPTAGGTATVTLKNPPADAAKWSLQLVDWDKTTSIGWIGEQYLDIAESGVFEVPSGIVFPLRIMILQVVKWNADKTAYIVLYEVQSWHPTLYDWDKGDWGDEPDPRYREAFLNAFGHSYYDVNLEAFTADGALPPTLEVASLEFSFV